MEDHDWIKALLSYSLELSRQESGAMKQHFGEDSERYANAHRFVSALETTLDCYLNGEHREMMPLIENVQAWAIVELERVKRETEENPRESFSNLAIRRKGLELLLLEIPRILDDMDKFVAAGETSSVH